MAAALRRRGLTVHEETEPERRFAALGWAFNGRTGWFAGKGQRRWDLYLAFEAVLSGAPVTGRTLDSLVSGHTFLGLARRASLSIWFAAYAFIEMNFLEAPPLWESVRREIRWARDTLCLLERNLRVTWSPTVPVSDASGWGGRGC